ncbi:xanthine dehydrogenase family protein molybdopterin-binding subunit [Verticiella sediminum]|uniref:Xanthine dehydrogenase family protein molybdopterin-binding subunit n=1 Tax=Verticiella sediminum TaxID=1247510 RepID=A0A556A6F9_9BURK|nr:xanthine dehydrogenase family protein molybdopterin-binding subunit [Verticiella sediminum]TSH88480.1 xanthine dehydrogenase family protein molybdopterin-binding subunit [Verticiella sediminum]
MNTEAPRIAGQGIGARLTRKEDRRFLTGRGQYVGDMRMPDMVEVAFARSPLAHARIRGVEKPEGYAAQVYVMQDMAGVKPILAASGLPGFQVSVQHPLALDKVRFVGEMVAMCVAPTRAQAEDLAEQVFVDYEELPVVADMHAAADGRGETLLHDAWERNVFLETHVDKGERTAAGDGVEVRRRLRTSRQCMMPLEGRGVLCWWDTRLDQLVMVSAAQLPHINRTGLAECLGIDEGRIRVVSPDVGGGFGYKGLLLPEEICCAWLAMRLRRPVRWLEDRREHLSANANCREHAYDIGVHVARDGRLVGIDCDAIVDSGAYSSYPFSACLEAAQVGSILPGPYRMDSFVCHTRSAATNKPPILPYRGVARTGVCFALEVMLDMAARELGIEPYALRERSLVRSADMPYTNITGKIFDSGDYVACMKTAVASLDWAGWRERQRLRQGGQRPQKRLGLGLAVFCEQGAHGTSVYHGWGIPMVPGFEQCHVRMTPDGVLEVQIGVHSHGQSLETTMAQVANSVIGIAPDRVRVLHGDTATSPYSTGTWGSRCAVMAGGAVGTACEQLGERLKTIAAGLLDVERDALVFVEGGLATQDGTRTLTHADIAHTWYRAPQRLPAGVDPGGLALTAGYRMQPDAGTFSYACHACVVEVDTLTGQTRLVNYVVCEDGGVLLNPMVVEGQLLGGLAQGIGTALYEEMPFDGEGQPLASTLADYMIPGAGEMPPLTLEHMQTPSPFSKFGQKGIGEGGAIAPPAAIVNAINDALAGIGAEVLEVPASPERVLAAIARAPEAA